MNARAVLGCLVAVALALPVPVAAAGEEDEPDVVVVQHLLVSFGRVTGRKIERKKKEAQQLAAALFERARQGEEFDALVKEYSDDAYPGIYKLTNKDVPLQPGSRARRDMVPYFGDVAFGLAVGEVGLARFRPGLSPYGWHVIKRLE